MQHRLVEAPLHLPRWKAAAIALAAAAWLVIIGFAATGNPVVRHDRLILGSLPMWQATLVFLAGWQVMLIAMMAPAALDFVTVWRTGPQVLAVTAAYVAVWTAFGLAVFYFDVGVHAAVNHWSWLAAHAWTVAGVTLVAAGAHQASSLKARSLAAGRGLMRGLDPSALGLRAAARAGYDYAIRCLGATAGLMLLAFALGASSVPLMAAITALMVFEARGYSSATVRAAGVLLVTLGVVVTLGPFVGLFALAV